MKRIFVLSTLSVMFTTLLTAQPKVSTTIVDDVFAAGNSQLQDLPNNSMWLFNGRGTTLRTDQVGAITYDVTPVGGSSEGFWAYFTDAGKPVVLSVGDKLTVSLTFSLKGFLANGQDIRWGVFDSLGTRNTTNLTGGQNDATFINDTGYGGDFYPSGTGSPFVLGRRTTLSNANVFNNFGDFAAIAGDGASDRQTLVDNTPYSITYTIERLTANDTRLTNSVIGGALSGLTYSAVETSPTPNSSFDYFAFRFSGANFTTKISWYELLVQYTPARPVITSQPQPTSLTLQVGSSVTLAVGVSGSGLTYQWLRDGQPVRENPSATTPVLSLANIQLGAAGTYTALIANAGGSATSAPVVLRVSSDPVPPPPAITSQPANTKVALGDTAVLSVAASGNNLFYQWFKNNAVLPGAIGSRLTLPNVQVGDSGSYKVVVSNSSGSVTSDSATLLVVSAMSAVGFSPAKGTIGTCTDGAISVQFDQPPSLGKSGRIVVTNSAGQVVDTIDMASNPQTKPIGGNPYVYYPVVITGKTATLYLHQPLPYNDTYSVTMEPAVLTDASGAPFSGFSDPTLWSFASKKAGLVTGTTSLVVAADNSGDFCSVQSAIDFVPANNTQPVTITVRKGIYNEINYVTSVKPFITIRGEDRDNTVIQYPNNANLNGGNSRAMFGVDAPDFTLENITLWNTTIHGGSQAEAFRGNNSRILLNRVNLKSFQDTLMMQGLGFVTDSYIEGDVDFMWGNGAIFFQNTELKSVTSGGYYTQIRNVQGQNGNVYVNCKLTSTDGVTGNYLARIDPTVFPYSQVVYINTAMGPHIAPAGWLLNNSNSAPNVQFWEYGSTDLKGAPLDVSQRLNVSRQITAAEATKWSDPGLVLGWVPYTVNAIPGTAITVNWSAAVGHSANDTIGLYPAGGPDANPISAQKTGSATTGHLTFSVPATAGTYELRYLLSDGVSRAATSNPVKVP